MAWKISAICCLVGLATSSIFGQPKDADKNDIDKLQGEWSMVSGSADGQPMPAQMLKQMKRVCKGDETSTTMAGQLYFKAKIAVDPSKKPKTIGYQMIEGITKGQRQLGIYEVDGDTFKSSFAKPGAERPKDFTSKPGDGRTVSVWKREKSSLPVKNVAVFVHEGVELLDFAGPAEVFSAAGRPRAFNVYTVAASEGDVVSQRFLTIKPRYTLANCPKPDIIVLPGGNTDIPLQDVRVIEWIQKSATEAEVVMSVCTGAFLLAKAGLLDGKEATTHWGSIEQLRQAAPKTKVLADRRVVDNGKIVTCAGVSAGIDGALHVVERALGTQAALETARYIEYRWDRTSNGNSRQP